MRRLLREPLLHFLLLGALLFLAHGLLRKDGGDPARIVVTQAQVEQLVAGFEKTRSRAPTPEELAGLVRDRVREEVYCREALALGLDRDDTIIRRRLRQKMEFVSDGVAAPAEPTEAELEEYLRAHTDAFRLEPRLTFRQVYLDPQKHGPALASDAEELLARLGQAGAAADLAALGDPLMLEPQYADLPASEVSRLFGKAFAQSLLRLGTGRWQGPLESSYGVHLVFVRERAEGRVPALAEVRESVRRDWEDTRRLAANDAFYAALLRRYEVTIEGAEGAGGPK